MKLKLHDATAPGRESAGAGIWKSLGQLVWCLGHHTPRDRTDELNPRFPGSGGSMQALHLSEEGLKDTWHMERLQVCLAVSSLCCAREFHLHAVRSTRPLPSSG